MMNKHYKSTPQSLHHFFILFILLFGSLLRPFDGLANDNKKSERKSNAHHLVDLPLSICDNIDVQVLSGKMTISDVNSGIFMVQVFDKTKSWAIALSEIYTNQ